jgi:hypothetical protein
MKAGAGDHDAYRFRALSLSEAAYPYLAGGSNVVKVRKR